MGVGDIVAVGGYTFRLTGIHTEPGPNYKADVGDVELIRNGQVLKTMHPEKRTYFSSTMPMTEAAIDSTIVRDVYVSLGERLEDSASPAWAMRVYYKPFVSWIWVGCLLMALGGGMAALDRRYRKKVTAASMGVANVKGLPA
jgi:cytochrome c-type biogenesis protein CcmF